MMKRYTKLKSLGKESENLRAWSANLNKWVENKFYLPHYKDEPFLLVPLEWVRPNLVISREKYFQNGCLTYIQDKQATIGPDGKRYAPTKKDLREKPEYMCNLHNIIKITIQAGEDKKNLVEYVLKLMDDKYTVLSVQELSKYL